MLGGGAHEHQATGGSGDAHGFEELANGVRAVGVLRAIAGIADGLLKLHALPVGVEFVGDDQRQTGATGGAHLRAMRNDVDSAIGVDGEKEIGMENRVIERGGGAVGVGSLRPRQIAAEL